MSLPAYVDTEDEIPDGFEEHYRPTEDGRFRLDAEGVEDIAGLKSALEKERAARRALKARVEALEAAATLSEDGDVADAPQPQGAEPAADPGAPDVTHALRDQLERRLVEAEAAAAVMAAKGVPELLLPILLPLLGVEEADGVFHVRVLGPDGAARRTGAGTPMSVADLIEELRRSDVYGRAFEGSGKSGSGAPPSSTGTEGMAVSLTDPAALGRHLADIAAGRMRVTG